MLLNSARRLDRGFSYKIESTPLDQKKLRKSRLNVTPLTIKPKPFREVPTHVVVKQHSSDITYGRIESTPTYNVYRAVTSEKPRNDLIIEEPSSENQSCGVPKQQAPDDETVGEHEDEDNLTETNDRHISGYKEETKDYGDSELSDQTEQDQQPKHFENKQEQQVPDKSKHALVEVPRIDQEKPKRSTRRRHRLHVDHKILEASVKNEELPISAALDATTSKHEPVSPNDESKTLKVDIGRYTENGSKEDESKDHYEKLKNYPCKLDSDPKEGSRATEPQTFSHALKDFKEPLEDEKIDTPFDTTDSFPAKPEPLSPINIQRYLEDIVEDKTQNSPDFEDNDNLEPYEPYEANKDIQMLMEKISDDEEEPVMPIVKQQCIQVILVDETKKKKKKKTNKPKNSNVGTASGNTTAEIPMAKEDIQLDEPAMKAQPVLEKKDTKEIAVQTTFVPDDIDSEDDSDQEILQYQQRSAIGGYLINTIPEEQEDEIPLSTPYQNNFTSPIDQEQVYEDRRLLCGDTRDHKSTPRRPYEGIKKPTFSDVSVLSHKPFSELAPQLHEAPPLGLSPYIGQEFETPKTQRNHNASNVNKTISRTGFTVESFLSETSDKKATESTQTWQSEFPHIQLHDIYSYEPENNKVGFEFDTPTEEVESSLESTAEQYKFFKTIYKPRDDIRDFVEEDKRRRNEDRIQAPPIKKHKMSSPHSPVDSTLLESDQYHTEETIPVPLVSEEPVLVKPSYQGTYEVRDFIKHDLQDKLEPIQATSTNRLTMKQDAQRERRLPDYELEDGQTDTKTPSSALFKTIDGNADWEEEEPLPTKPDYQPSYQIQDTIFEQQPHVRRFQEEPSQDAEISSEDPIPQPIRSRYEPRFEIIDLIAKEEKTINENPISLEPVREKEKPPVPLVPEQPRSILGDEDPRNVIDTSSTNIKDDLKSSFYQQTYEIKTFVLEEPDSVDKTGKTAYEEESETDDSFQETLEPIQLVYKPRNERERFILNEMPDNKKQQIQPFVSSREETIEPGYKPKYEVTEFTLSEEPINEEQKDKYIPDANLEEESFSPRIQDKTKFIRSNYQPKYEIPDFKLDLLPAGTVEEQRPEDKEKGIIQLSYQFVNKINDFVLQDESQSKRQSIKSARAKNRITASIPSAEEEAEPERISPVYHPRYEITSAPIMEPTRFPESPLMEQEPEIKHSVSQPKFEIRDLLVEELPKSETKPVNSSPDDDMKTTSFSTIQEPEGDRLQEIPNMKSPKYEIRDFVVEGHLNDEEKPTDQVRDEDISAAVFPSAENEPEPNYTILLPTKVKDFVIEEELIRNDGIDVNNVNRLLQTDANTKATNLPFVKEEQEPARSVHQPRYEIRDFVLEEQPKIENIPETNAVDVTEPLLIEQKPETKHSVYQPKFEVRDFVVKEQLKSETKPINSLPNDDMRTTPFSTIQEPERNRLQEIPNMASPKYEIRDFVVEGHLNDEEKLKDQTQDENINVFMLPAVENEPEPNCTILQPTKVKDFVIEEEPKKSDRNYVNNVSEEQKITRSIPESRYEINDLVLEEKPQNANLSRLPQMDAKIKATSPLFVQDEPEPARSVYQPRYEIQDFVQEEQPKIENIPETSTIDVTVSPLMDHEPEIKHSAYQPKFEIRDFVVEEQPNSETKPIKSLPDDEMKTTPYSTIQESERNHLHETPNMSPPKYEIRDFVVDEHPQIKETPEYPVADKKVNVTNVSIIERKPNHIHELHQPRNIGEFVLEETPETKNQPREPPSDEKVTITAVKDFQEEPEITRSYYETRFEISDFMSEGPTNTITSYKPSSDEKVETTAETMGEEIGYTRLDHSKYEVKAFEIHEEPKPKRDESVQDRPNTTKAPTVPNEPHFTKTVHSPKYEIPDFELDDLDHGFTERIETTHPKYPVSGEKINMAETPGALEETELTRPINQSRYNIREFVLKEKKPETNEGPSPETVENAQGNWLLNNVAQEKQPESEDKQALTTYDVKSGSNVEDFVQVEKFPDISRQQPFVADEKIDSASVPQLQEKPNSEGSRKHPVMNETMAPASAFFAEEQPERAYTVSQPEKKREFVLEEPKRKKGSHEPRFGEQANANALKLVLEEPGITQLAYELKYERNDFVLEEQTEIVDQPKYSEVDGNLKEPEQIPIADQQRGEIWDFVAYEPVQPGKTIVDVTEIPFVEQETEIKHSVLPPTLSPSLHQSTHEIRVFVLHEHSGNDKTGRDISDEKGDTSESVQEQLPERKSETETHKEIKLVQSEIQSRQKFGGFLLKDYKTSQTTSNEFTEQIVEAPSLKEQQLIRSLYEQQYKVKEFVLIEEPEQYNIAVKPLNEEHVEIDPLDEQAPVSLQPDPYLSEARGAHWEIPAENKENIEQPNTIFAPLVQQAEPDEITVDADTTSASMHPLPQREATLVDDDEPSRLDIDTSGEKSANMSKDFLNDLRKLLMQRHDLKEQATVIIDDESSTHSEVSRLQAFDKIQSGDVTKDINKPEINTFDLENIPPLKNRNNFVASTDGSGTSAIDLADNNLEVVKEVNTADKKIILPFAADNAHPERKPEEITENGLDRIDEHKIPPKEENINITKGQSNTDYKENMTMKITPSYLTQVDPSALVAITETVTVEQEIDQLKEEPSEVATDFVDNIPERVEVREEQNVEKRSITDLNQGQSIEVQVLVHQSKQPNEKRVTEEVPDAIKTHTEQTIIAVETRKDDIKMISVSDESRLEIDIISERPTSKSEETSVYVKEESEPSTSTREEVQKHVTKTAEESLEIVSIESVNDIVVNDQEQIKESAINNIDSKSFTKHEDHATEEETVLISTPQTAGGMTTDLVNDKQFLITTTTEQTLDGEIPSHLSKQSSLREVGVRITNVTKKEELRKETNREDDKDIKLQVSNSNSAEQMPNTQKEPVIIYPPNKPQGITIELIDEIQDPVKPNYIGTAVIENLVVDEPAQFKKRIIHTRTNTSEQNTADNVPEIAEQQFVREVDAPTYFVDGKPELVKASVLQDTFKESEESTVLVVEKTPVSGGNAQDDFEKVDEMINIAAETPIAYNEDDTTTKISPDYVRQEDPSLVIAAETVTSNMSTTTEYYQSETTAAIAKKIPETAEQIILREIDIPTFVVDGKQQLVKKVVVLNATEGPADAAVHLSEETPLPDDDGTINTMKSSDFDYDREDIYTQVSKEKIIIHDQEDKTVKNRVKTSGNTVCINHQPGATTIALVGKKLSPDVDAGKLVMEEVQISDDRREIILQETTEIVEQRFIRDIDNQDSMPKELPQSTRASKGVSHKGVKQPDQDIVWMTVRQSKKISGKGDINRVITLPIVNDFRSNDLSPTENLDFDFDNDETYDKGFTERQKEDEHYNRELEQVEKIPKGKEEIVTNEREDSEHVIEKKEGRKMELERFPDKSLGSAMLAERGGRKSSSSTKYSFIDDVNISRTATSQDQITENEENSRSAVRDHPEVTYGSTPGNDVWCTVRMKRWESDIRKENWSKQFRGKETTSDLSSSTESVDGSYDKDTSSVRAKSPNTEFSMRSERSSTDPGMSVRRKGNEDVNASTISINSNKDRECGESSFSRGTTNRRDEESVGYSMQITATDDGPLMTQEDTLSTSTMDTLKTDSSQVTSFGDVTTLPWIEVRKRDSIRQRLSFKKKMRDDTLKGVSYSDGKDRLLLVKIPQTMLTKIENDEKMLDTEVEIPWMELDTSAAGETQGYLPWVELADQAQNTDSDRILMLKISRQMILKASKGATSDENQIQLPWNEVVKYWEETGQITKGSLSRREKRVSANIAITFPSQSETETQLLEEYPNLPDMRLILPKKYCLDGSLQFKPMITVNEKRNIKVRINKTVKRKHDWSTLLRLSKSERKKYFHATGQDDWVVLADGTKWWRLQVDDMDEFGKVTPRSDGQKFQNYFEISSEDTDGKDSIDFNEFSKELGTKRQKQFSFVIDPSNLLTRTRTF